MGLLSGIMKSVINPVSIAQIAMGPAGWASLAARALFSAIGQQVLQNVGQRLGLPQPMIDLAKASFTGQVGGGANNVRDAIAGLATPFNLSLGEQGALQRSADQMTNQMTDFLLDGVRRGGDEESKSLASGNAKGGSLLMKIAVAMGQLMDQKMADMASLTDDIGNLGSIDNKNQAKLGELTGKLQGLGQEVNLLSNAMTNTIKSIGEANTTIARKG
jgi:hypothetical protein